MTDTPLRTQVRKKCVECGRSFEVVLHGAAPGHAKDWAEEAEKRPGRCAGCYPREQPHPAGVRVVGR